MGGDKGDDLAAKTRPKPSAESCRRRLRRRLRAPIRFGMDTVIGVGDASYKVFPLISCNAHSPDLICT
jgi:hypothetical protein